MSPSVHVVLATNDAYATYCAAVMHSMLEAAAEPGAFRVHVVTAGLGDAGVRLIEQVARDFGSRAEIHPIDDREVRRLPTLSHFTTDTYSRILAADALPAVAKFIYLDCDVAVCDDLAPLHATPLAGRPLAAVVHRNATCHEDFARTFGLTTVPDYVNAGVMLIDAELWRAEGVATQLVRWMHDNPGRLMFSDQCAINHHFLGRITHLHPRWNLEVRHYRDRWRGVPLSTELRQAMRAPAVLHYSGPAKPWRFDQYVPRRQVFLDSLEVVLRRGGQPPVARHRTLRNWLGEVAATARFRGSALLSRGRRSRARSGVS